MYYDKALFLAALVAYSAGCFAGGLTGCLTFTAAPMSQTFLQIALVQGLDMFHTRFSLFSYKFHLIIT
jgi:hypothetical protein